MSIVGTIQLLLNEVNVFWTNQQVLDAINQAQFWVWSQTKWTRMSWTLSMPIGTDLLPIPQGVIIPGWIESSITNADSTVTKTRAFPTTQRELEHFLRTWRSAGLDAPQYFVIWDAFTFRVYPRPDKVYNYTLWGVGLPPEIVDTIGDITAPPNVYHAIVNYTMALLMEGTRADLADAYIKLAEDQLRAYRIHIRNQQSHNIRRLRPSSVSISSGRISTPNSAGRFDLMQGGSIRALPTYYPLET